MTLSSDFRLPDHVAEAVRDRWPNVGPTWCDRVEYEFTEWLVRNHAEPITVMRARYGYVIAVEVEGKALVYRASPDSDGAAQTLASMAFSNLGVGPRVHDFGETETGTWTVTERIVPGTPLGDMNPTDIDTNTVAVTLHALVGQAAPAAGMPTVVDWLRTRLEDDNLRDLPPGQQPAPRVERRAALAVLNDLAVETGAGMCHGDASLWNFLQSNDGRLWLIDPRGMSGDVTYDLAVVALKTAPIAPVVIGARHLAKTIGVDAEEVLAWVTVASAARV